MVKLAFTGDVMLGRIVNEMIHLNGPRYVWGDFLPILGQADLRLINLECVISREWEPWHLPKAFYFRADPDAVEVLKAAGIDCVSLANNHALDFSKEGLLEMLDLLEENGIAYAGAGRNLEEAQRPAVLEAKGSKVAVYAFTDNEPDFAAGPESPGTNYTPITLEERYFRRVREGIEAARRLADIVVVSAHWGPNMVPRPSANFRAFARAVMDAGADIFHGHSAHVFQGVEIYENRPILYDTGDFVDDYYVGDEKNDQSFLFLLTASKRGVEGIELFPALISRCQVNRAREPVLDEIYGRMRERSLEMGTRLERAGDRLLVATSALSASPSSSQG